MCAGPPRRAEIRVESGPPYRSGRWDGQNTSRSAAGAGIPDKPGDPGSAEELDHLDECDESGDGEDGAKDDLDAPESRVEALIL